MNLYIIKYGLGGGFGGANNYEVIQTEDLEDAEKWAYENACDEYDSYSGMHGLRSEDEIIKEEDCDEEEARYIYEEEREGWLEYCAFPYSKEVEKIAENHHYTNSYKDLTDEL